MDKEERIEGYIQRRKIYRFSNFEIGVGVICGMR